ncbi:Mur ligase [Syncephalis pseudoplumigaleata]|uniref:Mur ligase n=1 Tax=Syncephalis pseudoplumigaleata TaxID=1712513 RepID=A0A4P9YZV2_9FUNG|nr:Mur ligase [Syncephalis pseudoplumigaleata]|eukprot:RKP25676.1 Mur ligase [Syncephalis pseudoplumigaleata]
MLINVDVQKALQQLKSLRSITASSNARLRSGHKPDAGMKAVMRQWFLDIGHQLDELNQLNAIHVTGTKGKGSVCIFSESILNQWRRRHGTLRIGMLTSPHLVDVRERIRLDGEMISEALFADYFNDCWTALKASNTMEHASMPGYASFMTLMAFHVFIREKVNLVIIEVNAGGEYDLTNIIPRPTVCGITAIGIDHVALLGDTIEQIAWHKAGIAKPSVPLYSVPQQHEAATKVIETRTAAIDTHWPNDTIHLHLPLLCRLSLPGEHQYENASLAVALCDRWLCDKRGYSLIEAADDVLVPEVVRGLQSASWPGRAQTIVWAKPDSDSHRIYWFLDGAHTQESMQVSNGLRKHATIDSFMR